MKKQNEKTKKTRNTRNGNPSSRPKDGQSSNLEAVEAVEKGLPKQKAARTLPRKSFEKKKEKEGSIFKYISKSGQFLRESKVELKKVKWPTRKELLASTAVVIFLVIVLSFFLGLVDFGLIKIIKNIVG